MDWGVWNDTVIVIIHMLPCLAGQIGHSYFPQRKITLCNTMAEDHSITIHSKVLEHPLHFAILITLTVIILTLVYECHHYVKTPYNNGPFSGAQYTEFLLYGNCC